MRFNLHLKELFLHLLKNGDKKGGVVWHTQGAGKSNEMAYLAGRIMVDQRLKNPTIIMITDRQDLDRQLFNTFSNAQDVLGEPPTQVENRKELRELLTNKPSGGILSQPCKSLV